MLKRSAVVIALLMGSTAQAADVLVYSCDAPRGYRAEYGSSASESIRWETDSFSQVRPTVVWIKAAPGKLFVSWGHSVPAGALDHTGLAKQLRDSKAFKEATVVSRDEHSIQAVYAQCATCATHLFGLFPNLQLFTMSDVSYMALSKPGAIAGGVRAFASLCKRLG